MADAANRPVDEPTPRQAHEGVKRRRDAALRLPPLHSGHRDSDGRRADAPARGYFVAGGED